MIQSAIDALPNQGGKIFIKEETYIISSTITIQYPHTIIGAGKGATELKIDAVDIDGIYINPISAFEFDGVSLKDLTINGNGKGRYGIIFDGGIDTAWKPRYVVGCYFENITVRSCKEFGVYENSNWGNTYVACKIMSNGTTSATKGGICLFSNVTTFVGCRIDWNGTGVIARAGSGNAFYNCVIEGNYYHGVYGYSTPEYNFYPNRNFFDGSWFELNNVSLNANIRDIFITGGGTGYWSFRNCLSSGANVDYSAYISSSSWYTVIENFRAYTKKIVFKATYGTIIQCSGSIIDAASFPLASTVMKLSSGLVNSGTFTANGTGSQTQFTIPHGLVSAPTIIELSAKTKDATGEKYWTADAINITVNFVIPPPVGTNNVVLSWKAEV